MGKTSLARRLVSQYPDLDYVAEQFYDLKYLDEYYYESQKSQFCSNKYNKYALKLQLDFLGQRYRNELDHSDQRKTTIFDRCIYEDSLVFARTMKTLNYVDDDEMTIYE